MLVGLVEGVVILLSDRLRSRPLLRMAALAMVAIGVVAYRWDTTMVGQLVTLTYAPQEIVARYTEYAPSLIEIVFGMPDTRSRPFTSIVLRSFTG